MKKASATIALVMIVLMLAVFSTVLLSACGKIGGWVGGDVETNTYTAEGDFDAIEVNTSESDVSFRVSEDGKCSVVCVEFAKIKHTVEVSDGILKITETDEREWYEKAISIFAKDISVTVCLPLRTYASLKVDSSTANVDLPKEFSFNEINIKGTTGNVACNSTVSTCRIEMTTGNISLSEITLKEADLTTTTGNIAVSAVSCDAISASVSTGKVAMEDVKCKTLVSTGSTGTIKMSNAFATESFSIKRSTGNVVFDKCDAGEITVITTTGSVKGTLCSEKIFLTQSTTGRISVPKTISGGICTIETTTGSVKIELAD